MTTLGSGVEGAVRRIDTAYDSQGNAFKFTSFGNTSATTVVNEVLRVYNGLGQLITEYQTHGAAVDTNTTPKVQYAYSQMAGGANHSRLTSMTYPNGKVLTYNYASGINNDISRLSSLSDAGGTLETYDYLGLSTVVKRGHPVVDLTYITANNGDAGDQYGGLDRFGRIVDQNWRAGGVSPLILDRNQYTHDRNSNRLTKSNVVSMSDYFLDLDEAYTYDGLNQIASFDRDDGYDQDWTYDGLGNWSSFNDDGTTQTRGHNAQNEITNVSGATSPVYDANGNMITDETNKDFVYDAWNRLVEVKNASNVTVATYEYDGLTRRISETESGTTKELYYSAAWQVLEERIETRTNDVTMQYVWSSVYIYAMILRDRDTGDDGTLDERLWVTQDANYNVTALVDNSGAVVERFTYSPFGVASVRDGNYATDSDGISEVNWIYRHQGGRWNVQSGLVDFRQRPISLTMGRWMKNDPIGYRSLDINLYRYEFNNATTYVDPSGLEGILVTIAGALLPGIASGAVVASGGLIIVGGEIAIAGYQVYNLAEATIEYYVAVEESARLDMLRQELARQSKVEVYCRSLLVACILKKWKFQDGQWVVMQCEACYGYCKNTNGTWPYSNCPLN